MVFTQDDKKKKCKQKSLKHYIIHIKTLFVQIIPTHTIN